MKKTCIVSSLVILLAFGLWLGLKQFEGKWSGVDETVVEQFARQANRPPQEPLINTDQGDLLLFFFLIAGTAGGFVAGYCFRALFPPAAKG